MKQYLDLVRRIIDEGVWVNNPRTNSKCLTVINHTLTYDVANREFPCLTTKKVLYKQAINEMVCYIRGYHLKEDFHKLGVKSWDANIENWRNLDYNSNKTNAGIIYGRSAEQVGTSYDWVIEQLLNNPNDRGIIWNFWNPEYFNKGCLRPCMYNHQFSVLGDTLYLTSNQRSVDVPLGLVWNMVQCYFLLAITAKFTGYKAGTVTHNLVNCHIYENQLELIKEQLTREPRELPKLIGLENITYQDLMVDSVTDKLSLENYNPHPAIKFPFTV